MRVLSTLALRYRDGAGLEVNISDVQADEFCRPAARVQQAKDQGGVAGRVAGVEEFLTSSGVNAGRILWSSRGMATLAMGSDGSNSSACRKRIHVLMVRALVWM